MLITDDSQSNPSIKKKKKNQRDEIPYQLLVRNSSSLSNKLPLARLLQQAINVIINWIHPL